MTHPDEALFAGERVAPAIAACEHYAGTEARLRKALALQDELPFDLTGDCEDGAPAGREAEHVAMVADLVASADNRHGQMGVRVHDPAHTHGASDIDAVLDRAGDRVAHLTIPKVVSADQLARTIDHVREGAARRGLARAIPLHVLIETHGALAEVWCIAALPWLRVLDFGLMDFVSAHGGAIPASALRSPGQFTHPLMVRAKAEIAAAAHAHALVPSHNVCLELSDRVRIAADAEQARAFGFTRMWSIHPAQIAPIVAAMQPDHGDVALAAAVLLKAQAAAWGPVRHDDELHDRASYRLYWTLLQRARATGVALPSAAEQAFFTQP